MKIKAISIYITSIMVLVSFIAILVIFNIDHSVVHMITNLLYGVFGSSLVSMMISIYEYSNSKKKLLNDFYLEGVKLLNSLMSISFFELSSTVDAYLMYYFFKDLMGTKEVKDAFILELKSKIQIDYPEEEIIVSEKSLLAGANYYLPLFKKSVESYVNFVKETDFHTIALLLNDTFFLVKHLGQDIKQKQQELYELLMDSCKYVKDRSIQLNNFVSQGQCSYKKLRKDFNELASYFFTIEDNGNDKQCWATVVDKFYDVLEEYRCLMYKKEYIPKKHEPRYTCVKK